ncbi:MULTISPECIES: hypothetical protein [unclassified Streptomyces]|uniref:Apea-like HEPN domain-containing protein n=1 Tax=Streptomyces sp. NBC_00060 TaxID=2975636 RepID=A0AAU2H627_9ACTN
MLLTFLVALPFPCPLPHGTVFSRTVEGEVHGLDGIALRVTPEAPDLPADMNSRVFVSLKFWQVKERAAAGNWHLGALTQVASDITGKPLPTPDEPEPTVESYRTVVEMITVQNADTSHASWPNTRDEALDRCFRVLSDVSAMTRLVKHHGHPIATKEQVPFALWFARRPESCSYADSVGGMLFLSPPADPVTEVLNAEQMERLTSHLTRVWDGSPLELAIDRSVEASTFMQRDGDYGNAVIHAALSSEIILDSTLALMLWEEQLVAPSTEAAIAVFDETRGGLASRVRREYSPRLGGTWDPDKIGPVQTWSRNLARLRGRIVHRGYRPTELETAAALSASDELLEFVKERLARRVKRYPRTALLMLGEPGLRRLGGWRAASGYLEAGSNRPDDWFREYSAWRTRVDAAL